MMKLLVIAPQNPYPAKDGGKIGIYYPVIHLSKHFKIHFVFITPNAVSPAVYEHFKEHNVTIYPQVLNTKDTTAGYLLNITSKLPYKFQKYCTASILKNLEAICEEENINNVWCNHSHVAWYGLQLKEKNGANIFLREHNIEYSLVQQVMQVQTNSLKKAFVWYQYKKTKAFEIECWSKFSKTFFISDSDYGLASQNNNKKGILLYDSFKQQNTQLNVSKEPYSFIYTASLETFQNQYNLQKFINEIWNKLIQKDNRWKLYITGNTDEIFNSKLNINTSTNIINLGFVNDIESVVASKKYFISPTYMGSGVRIKVLNALAAGSVCMVTLKDLQMLNILKDEENIIKFDDFENFYSKLLRLETNTSWYNSISLHAMQVGSSFSWKDYAETVHNEVAQTESLTSR